MVVLLWEMRQTDAKQLATDLVNAIAPRLRISGHAHCYHAVARLVRADSEVTIALVAKYFAHRGEAVVTSSVAFELQRVVSSLVFVWRFVSIRLYLARFLTN